MRFAEFFAGIGLVRLGLEKSGWECVYANDIDPKKVEMYQANFPHGLFHFELGDIRAVKPETIPQFDLATASFPCTDLSLAGARAGLAGEHSSALWPFVELLNKLDRLRPPLIMLENVVGFLTSNGGGDLKTALLKLTELGYSIDAFIIDASHFVPQSRQRLFIVGCRQADLATADRRSLSFFESEVRPPQLANFILETPDIMWKLRELPRLPERTVSLEDILEDLPRDSHYWWTNDRSQYLLNQMSERHRRVADEMIHSERISVGTVFRRVRNGRSMAELRCDSIAGCLRTPKGGSARQILFVAGNGGYRARLLTERECARLMGADDFNVTVPLNQALFGFGDAVCVPVIDWIAQNYLNPVLGEMRPRLKVAS